MWIDISKIADWQVVTEKVVGGLEWIGFSRQNPEKLLCISSQKATIIDCSNGNIVETCAEYDENRHIAVCDDFPEEEVMISGQYGGKMEYSTPQGDKVTITVSSKYVNTVTFVSGKGTEQVIFKDYGFYTCGFSYDGQYFVFAQDAGITILGRQCVLMKTFKK